MLPVDHLRNIVKECSLLSQAELQSRQFLKKSPQFQLTYQQIYKEKHQPVCDRRGVDTPGDLDINKSLFKLLDCGAQELPEAKLPNCHDEKWTDLKQDHLNALTSSQDVQLLLEGQRAPHPGFSLVEDLKAEDSYKLWFAEASCKESSRISVWEPALVSGDAAYINDNLYRADLGDLYRRLVFLVAYERKTRMWLVELHAGDDKWNRCMPRVDRAFTRIPTDSLVDEICHLSGHYWKEDADLKSGDVCIYCPGFLRRKMLCLVGQGFRLIGYDVYLRMWGVRMLTGDLRGSLRYIQGKNMISVHGWKALWKNPKARAAFPWMPKKVPPALQRYEASNRKHLGHTTSTSAMTPRAGSSAGVSAPPPPPSSSAAAPREPFQYQ